MLGILYTWPLLKKVGGEWAIDRLLELIIDGAMCRDAAKMGGGSLDWSKVSDLSPLID